MIWQKGVNPDDESMFYVNYFVPNSASPLTDLNVGSVTRTLSEVAAAVALDEPTSFAPAGELDPPHATASAPATTTSPPPAPS